MLYSPFHNYDGEVSPRARTAVVVSPSKYTLPLLVPEFSDLDPDDWFSVYESELQVHNFTIDLRKYCELLPRLPLSILRVIGSILENPPTEDKYEALKHLVLQIQRPTRMIQVEQLKPQIHLLYDETEWKPAPVFREVPAVHERTDPIIIHELHEISLPEPVQARVTIVAGECLTELANAVDSVTELTPLSVVCAVVTPTFSTTPDTHYQDLRPTKTIRVCNTQTIRIETSHELHNDFQSIQNCSIPVSTASKILIDPANSPSRTPTPSNIPCSTHLPRPSIIFTNIPPSIFSSKLSLFISQVASSKFIATRQPSLLRLVQCYWLSWNSRLCTNAKPDVPNKRSLEFHLYHFVQLPLRMWLPIFSGLFVIARYVLLFYYKKRPPIRCRRRRLPPDKPLVYHIT